MHEPTLILTITVGLAIALLLGYLTQRLGLSPIVGYLLAGLAVGPFTPGVVADAQVAGELAEIGVILLMFGVGLRFHWKELLATRAIALPGAVGQSLAATGLGALVAVGFGWTLGSGIVLGIAISVASTVVLIRVLTDHNLIGTRAGHVAVGWLVVEDIFTVIVLVILPAVVSMGQGGGGLGLITTLLSAIGKLALLLALVLLVGARVIPWVMERVARTRSRELFTLTVLVIALGIATTSAWLFGASMALGAFLAGMVVAQSSVSHQAASDALPMRDAFAVLFFLSVGMLFDPMFLLRQPWLVVAVLGIILVAKPAAAMLIVLVLGHPLRTALTVAVGLAQIGEFSFILSQLGRALGVLPEDGHNVLVAGALLSISLNPLLFARIPGVERWLSHRWRFPRTRGEPSVQEAESARPETDRERPGAVVIGYGPIGRAMTRLLVEGGIQPVIVDMNVDAVKKLQAEGYHAIYGDAGRREILEAARIDTAEYLLVTPPDLMSRLAMIASARVLNPGITILARGHYVAERLILEESGVTGVAYEEAEVAAGLARLLLGKLGKTDADIESEVARIRDELAG